MLSAVVLAAIGIGVGIESGSHPAGLFGTGQHAFIAGFPEQPSLTTYVNPDWGSVASSLECSPGSSFGERAHRAL